MSKIIAALFSLISLAACLLIPVLSFWGTIDPDTYKQWLAVASVAWFVSATTWSAKRTS